MFHYRGQGGDEGNVLVGFEAVADTATLEQALQSTGYDHTNVNDADSIKLFAC
jgi:hypothetical protein